MSQPQGNPSLTALWGHPTTALRHETTNGFASSQQEHSTAERSASYVVEQAARNRILLIEDDLDLRNALQSRLTDEGFAVEVAGDGKVGLDQALANSYHLVVVDLNLPSLSGFEICRRLRKDKEQQAIMILTSQGDEVDKILGFEVGADDYVTKPFSIREMLGRVRAILRRSSALAVPLAAEQERQLVFGELVIDLFRRKVSRGGEAIDLTATEFDILETLALSPGKPFTRTELMEQVWGYKASSFDPTVTTHLSRLRAKLEPDPNSSRFIKTVRGVGYRFVEAHELE